MCFVKLLPGSPCFGHWGRPPGPSMPGSASVVVCSSIIELWKMGDVPKHTVFIVFKLSLPRE